MKQGVMNPSGRQPIKFIHVLMSVLESFVHPHESFTNGLDEHLDQRSDDRLGQKYEDGNYYIFKTSRKRRY